MLNLPGILLCSSSLALIRVGGILDYQVRYCDIQNLSNGLQDHHINLPEWRTIGLAATGTVPVASDCSHGDIGATGQL
jgi:hypothetical protein